MAERRQLLEVVGPELQTVYDDHQIEVLNFSTTLLKTYLKLHSSSGGTSRHAFWLNGK